MHTYPCVYKNVVGTNICIVHTIHMSRIYIIFQYLLLSETECRTFRKNYITDIAANALVACFVRSSDLEQMLLGHHNIASSSKIFQAMVCRPFGAKPMHKAIMTFQYPLNPYYNMTVWILAGNYISFTIVAGLIRLYMPGVKKYRVIRASTCHHTLNGNHWHRLLEIPATIGVTSNITTFNYVCRFTVNEFKHADMIGVR